MTTQTPVIQLAPIGTNYPALSIPGTDQIHGVLIDNPSGAWLYLRTTGDFIPPYTIGFARSFDVGRTSIEIDYVAAGPNGPGGQVSTLAGDPARVILSSDPVGNASGNSSGGTSYIEQFTPYLTVGWALNATWNNGIINTGIIGAIANKRIRVLGVQAWIDLGFNVLSESRGWLALFPDSGPLQPFLEFKLDESNLIYTVPTDFPIGTGVNYTVRTDWADIFFNGSITYQVI